MYVPRTSPVNAHPRFADTVFYFGVQGQTQITTHLSGVDAKRAKRRHCRGITVPPPVLCGYYDWMGGYCGTITIVPYKYTG
jgi:hypothetical protein